MTAVKKRVVSKKTPTSKASIPANAIRYKIVTKLEGSNEVYEATAEIPGFRATKVLRNDGTTTFSTRSALTKACKDRAAALKRTPFFDFGSTAVTAPKSAPKARKVTTFCSTGSACPVTGACASN